MGGCATSWQVSTTRKLGNVPEEIALTPPCHCATRGAISYSAITAVPSISTLARGSSSPATTTSVMAGKCRPIVAAIGLSDLALASDIFGLVGHVPGEPHEMARLTARSRQHVDDVFQRLLDLGDEIVALELRLRVPADLAGDENLAALRGDAVGVALGREPSASAAQFQTSFCS